MNILITGIHGFVGSHLVAALTATHTIYGLDIVSPQKTGVTKTFGWNELESLPDVDAIIHLAGKAHDTKNQTNAQVYFDINTGLTEKIYDWYLGSTATKFVFFSSVKAAADTVEGEILTEEVAPKPKGPYGESKIKAEEYILSKEPIANNELSTEKKTYILRPCMIHGQGNKGNLNLLYNVVSRGIPYPLGAFNNKRSFTSIDNLCYLIEQIIQHTIPSGIYQVADDEPVSTNELIALIAESTGCKKRIWHWNKSIITRLANVGDRLHLPLNNERLQKLTENYVVSNAKIKRALNISTLPISAKEGLRKTIASFQAQKK